MIGTIGAAILGFLIGQANGTLLPFAMGVALCAASAFVVIVLTEPRPLLAPTGASKPVPPEARVPEDLG